MMAQIPPTWKVDIPSYQLGAALQVSIFGKDFSLGKIYLSMLPFIHILSGKYLTSILTIPRPAILQRILSKV